MKRNKIYPDLTQFRGFGGQFKKCHAFFKCYMLKTLLIVSLIFIGVFLLTGLFFYNNQEAAASILDLFFANAVDSDVISSTGSISFINLLANNVRASCIAWVYGFVPFLFMSSYSLIVNAAVMGLLIGDMAYIFGVGFGKALLVSVIGVLPHGLFEIPALLLSMTMGIVLCIQLNRKLIGKKEGWAFDTLLGEMARFFGMYIFPMLVIAAVLETFVTPLFLNMILGL